MKKIGILYSFLSWVIAITLILMSHNSNPYIFTILLDLILTCLAIFFGINYLKKYKENFLHEAIKFSIMILIINIFLDQIYYNLVGMPMNFIEYMLNVGFIYLLYPIIICSFGFIFDNIYNIIK